VDRLMATRMQPECNFRPASKICLMATRMQPERNFRPASKIRLIGSYSATHLFFQCKMLPCQVPFDAREIRQTPFKQPKKDVTFTRKSLVHSNDERWTDGQTQKANICRLIKISPERGAESIRVSPERGAESISPIEHSLQYSPQWTVISFKMRQYMANSTCQAKWYRVYKHFRNVSTPIDEQLWPCEWWSLCNTDTSLRFFKNNTVLSKWLLQSTRRAVYSLHWWQLLWDNYTRHQQKLTTINPKQGNARYKSMHVTSLAPRHWVQNIAVELC
jgi:hypothetical protein